MAAELNLQSSLAKPGRDVVIITKRRRKGTRGLVSLSVFDTVRGNRGGQCQIACG